MNLLTIYPHNNPAHDKPARSGVKKELQEMQEIRILKQRTVKPNRLLRIAKLFLKI